MSYKKQDYTHSEAEHRVPGAFIGIKGLIAQNATKSIGGVSIDRILDGRKVIKKEEWILFCASEFYNQLAMIYGSIMSGCTEKTCPTMSACKGYEYKWNNEEEDEVQIISARMYIEKIFEWASSEILKIPERERSYKWDNDLQSQSTFTSMFRRFFRIYAHIYYHHIEEIISKKMIYHLNMSFRHFAILCLNLSILTKVEVKPLEFLLIIFTKKIYEDIAETLPSKNEKETEQLEFNLSRLSQSKKGKYCGIYDDMGKTYDNEKPRIIRNNTKSLDESLYNNQDVISKVDECQPKITVKKSFLQNFKSSILNVAHKVNRAVKVKSMDYSDIYKLKTHSCLHLTSSSMSSSKSSYGTAKFTTSRSISP